MVWRAMRRAAMKVVLGQVGDEACFDGGEDVAEGRK
jgi:hypothetical protein